jgi:hypothetical protein
MTLIKTKNGNTILDLLDLYQKFAKDLPDEHWLASGCFYSHDFKAYWEKIKSYVPISIPHSENLWLQFYDKQYRKNFSKS